MNAAAPPDCCVSMTAQLVMYYNSTQLNSTVAVGDVPGHYASYANPLSVCNLKECFTGENTPPLPCYVLIQLYILKRFVLDMVVR